MFDRVFIILKNSDFTEGRGPMLFDRVFDTFSAADQYVMGKSGIFGSEQCRDERSALDAQSGRWTYNGFDIQEANVLTKDDILTPEDRNKLSTEIQELEAQLARARSKLK
jgi:hypothetical protein